MAAVTAIRCEPNSVASATFVSVRLCKLGLKILDLFTVPLSALIGFFALQIMV